MISKQSKIQNFSLIFLAGYALVYLLIRLVNLTLLPAHYDELAQLERLEDFIGEGEIFIGLSDALKWTQMWVLAAFSWLPAGSLWNGRFSSVLMGLGGGIGMYVLALELYRRKSVAVAASLLYFVVPSIFFYDRMIMPDGLLTTLGIWTMIFSLWAVRRMHFGWAVVTGLTICVASLTKISGLAYLTIPIVTLILFKPLQFTPKNWKFLAAIYAPALVGAFTLLLFLNTGSAVVYTTKVSSTQINYLQLWLTNSGLTASWVTSMLTQPLMILGVIGVVLALICRSRAGLYLLVIPLAVALPFIAVSQTWYPRYLLPVVPSLLILTAWTLDMLAQRLGKFSQIARWRWAVFAVVGLALLIPALFTDFWLLFDPAQASLHPEERRQYIEGWPNTYSLTEAVGYVENLARQHSEIYVAVNSESFVVKEGLKYYFQPPANVRVVKFDPFSGHAVQDLNEKALKRPTFLILNPAREKGLDELWTKPQLFVQAEKMAQFDRPGGETSIDVYQWHSIPAMAEQWARQSGIEQPVIMSRFTQVADSIGVARFEALSDQETEANFALIDADTLASGVLVQNSDNWQAQLPTDWVLTRFVPGSWYLFRLINRAPPQHSAKITLGEAIALTGFDLSHPRGNFTAGQPIHLTLHWQALKGVTEDYVVFAQLIGSDGQLYAQQDQAPLLATTRWQPGYQLADGYTISLDNNVPPGLYRLITGMYQSASGQRLPAYQSDGNRWPDDAIGLTEVTIN